VGTTCSKRRGPILVAEASSPQRTGLKHALLSEIETRRLLEIVHTNSNAGGSIQCRERLGGILNYYHREAA
jgi:hypothetical protein